MTATYLHPPREQWSEIVQRRACADDAAISARVAGIVERVKLGGDAAIKELATEIEGACPEQFAVTQEEFARAEAATPHELKSAIAAAARNIRLFHEAQRPAEIDLETTAGVRCVQRAVPIQKVGLYVPGGTAPLLSTVLMLTIPARVAGCSEIVMCTPAGPDGRVADAVLYAAKFCGLDHVYKVGGAQAIAAMAFGTATIPRVDKIFGPGNRYVTRAKEVVSMAGCAIDMPAGPSEVLVVAEKGFAEARFAAADMLSQAEHGADSEAVLVCDDEGFAGEVAREIEAQLPRLPRREIAAHALASSRIVVLRSRDEMIDFANLYAAEHLLLQLSEAWEAARNITAAGSIFVGNHSPESAGDYASGTNHTLPTGGWARSVSGVNLDSFMRRTTIQELSPQGLGALAKTITVMARAEGLEGHARAVEIRDAQAEKAAAPHPKSPLELVRPNIRAMAPYSTARDEFGGGAEIFLDANENPYDWGLGDAPAAGFNRYPDPRATELKKTLARIKGIPAEEIFIGNGSDEAIDLVFRVFCEPGRDNVVAIAPSYGMYRVAAATNSVEMREVALGRDFEIDVEALLAATDARTKAIFLCSPNNPSGNLLPRARVTEILDRFPGLVVIDEAYIDFADEASGETGFAHEIACWPRLVVLQTLSKAWGMAGLRLGLAFGAREVIEIFGRVKYPYNISAAVQAIALQRLREGEMIERQVAEIRAERERLAAALAASPAIERVFPSDANFLLMRVRGDARALYERLLGAGIIVRDRSHIDGCEGCLRITVGTPAENDKLLKTIAL